MRPSVAATRRAGAAQLRARILVLWRFRCASPWCRIPLSQKPLDLHHVVKRSQMGGETLQNLVPLCRRCHDATDLPGGDAKRLEIGVDIVDGLLRPGQAVANGFRFWWA